MAKKTVLDVLMGARALVADPKTWTHGTMARRADGAAVPARSKTATCFCAMGALEKAAPVIGGASYWGAYTALNEECRGAGIVMVNDGPRGRYRILKAFDRAIKKLTPKAAAPAS